MKISSWNCSYQCQVLKWMQSTTCINQARFRAKHFWQKLELQLSLKSKEISASFVTIWYHNEKGGLVWKNYYQSLHGGYLDRESKRNKSFTNSNRFRGYLYKRRGCDKMITNPLGEDSWRWRVKKLSSIPYGRQLDRGTLIKLSLSALEWYSETRI